MSLTTGKKIAQRKFTEMPMTEAAMKQTKTWAMKDHIQNGLTFKNRHGKECKFNDNNEDTPIAHPGNGVDYMQHGSNRIIHFFGWWLEFFRT